MRLTSFYPVTAALGLVLLAGCSSSPPFQTAESAPPPPAPAPDAEPAQAAALADDVPILGKATGDDLAAPRHGLSLLEPGELGGLGLEAAFADHGLELDPAAHAVVLLSLGLQPGDGYAADVTALQLKGSVLYVQGTATAPESDVEPADNPTTPYCAVVIPKPPANTTLRSDVTSRP